MKNLQVQDSMVTTKVTLNKKELSGPFDPWFITGYIDGEGCFWISLAREKRLSAGWRVRFYFDILIHKKDKVILEQIKNYYGVGRIYEKNDNSVQYVVYSVKELQVIRKHFEKYQLCTKKRADYELWIKALDLIQNKEHLTEQGLQKIVAIRASLNLGLSAVLKEAFPKIIPVPRPLITDQNVPYPQWIAGFASGEGCFLVNIKKSKTHSSGFQVILRFQLTQHVRDEQLMRSLIECFGCGNVYFNGEAVDFIVEKFSDIETKIIPFFNKYPIVGVKSQDFQDWCFVGKIMQDKEHLTQDGLDKIIKIKAGMNKGRFSVDAAANGDIRVSSLKDLSEKIPARQLRRRNLSTSTKNKNIAVSHSLSPWYVTGLVDGEGSFGVSISKRPERSLGYSISVAFEIALQASDKHILVKLKDYFGVGGIYKHCCNMFRYKVSSIKDIRNVIIPHFDKFNLLTQKRADFYIFKRIITILSKGPLSPADLQEVVNLKAVLNLGLSSALKAAFPNTVISSRPVIPFEGIPDPLWVCGFTEGEGCFYITLVKSSLIKTGIEVRLGFVLTQHSRDLALLRGLISFFGCGNLSIRGDNSAGDIRVSSLKDLREKIIPFFEKNPLLGTKCLSFKRLCLVVDIVKEKGHLTNEGLKNIRDIKSKEVL